MDDLVALNREEVSGYAPHPTMQQPFTRGRDASTYTVSLDVLAAESVNEAVTKVVAAYTDRTPTDLEPLAESIDPDALDALFAPPVAGKESTVREVRFEYEGCLLTVRATGEIRVQPTRASKGGLADGRR